MGASIDGDQMPAAQRDGPQIAEDPEFQRRSWVAERIGWAVIALLLAAGLAGLFGSVGPLNGATAGEAGDPLRVEYARLARHGASTTLQITVDGDAIDGDSVRVAVSRDYLDAVERTEVLPEPQAVELASDAYVYVFAVAERGAPLTIAFDIEPRQYWRLRGTVGLPDGVTLPITQFVFP